MALTRHNEATPHGVVELEDSLGGTLPYRYAINLAHVVSVSRFAGVCRVQLLAGDALDLSEQDADTLEKLLFP